MFTRDDRSTASETFEDVVLPHLDAAYRLARWLTRNDQDAEDAVQEASLRALRYFRTYAGRNGRAWFLRIVRNACWNTHAHKAPAADLFDEERHSEAQWMPDPEALLLQAADATMIGDAIRGLPDRFRELLVLRELEGLSYQELAEVLDIPIGTVMSGLSRARQAFRKVLGARSIRGETPNGSHGRRRDGASQTPGGDTSFVRRAAGGHLLPVQEEGL